MIDQHPPWKAVTASEPEAAAVRALAAGTATEDQQKRVLDFFMRRVCDIEGISYRPGDTHSTAFNEGRRFCGKQIINILKQPKESQAR
jgi:hypothetical protein